MDPDKITWVLTTSILWWYNISVLFVAQEIQARKKKEEKRVTKAITDLDSNHRWGNIILLLMMLNKKKKTWRYSTAVAVLF